MRRTAALALVVAVLAVVGCTASPTPDEAPEAVSLRLATDDAPGELVSAQQIQWFADRVAELSGDLLLVEPDWAANGDLEHAWDQAAAQLVIDGDDELALIPSRAWDLLDVTSLQALSTPMLITDQGLAATVVGGDLAPQLMSGLDAAGVTGLAMFPEALRHPFGFSGALLEPSDFAGGVVRTPASAASTLLFEALGATAVDSEPDAATMVGSDSDYGREPSGTATGNLVWYPKVNVLVANSSALGELSAEQRGWLEQAALDTRQWAVENLPSEPDAAGAWCASGGTIAAASDEQLAAFAAAVAPVRAQLAADTLTGGLIAAIEGLKAAGDPEPPVVACP
jgi:TRAP-type C4-dicarboxylate transport system substrate-binding protein